MESNLEIGEKILSNLRLLSWAYRFASCQALYFSTCLVAFIFFLKTCSLPMGFLPLGKVTKSQVLFSPKDLISSYMTLFQTSPSIDSITSFIVLGSPFVVDNTKDNKMSCLLYILGSCLSQPYLLMIRIYCYNSSSNSINSSKSWPLPFSSNSTFCGSLSILTSSTLEVPLNSLKIASIL